MKNELQNLDNESKSLLTQLMILQADYRAKIPKSHIKDVLISLSLRNYVEVTKPEMLNCPFCGEKARFEHSIGKGICESCKRFFTREDIDTEFLTVKFDKIKDEICESTIKTLESQNWKVERKIENAKEIQFISENNGVRILGYFSDYTIKYDEYLKIRGLLEEASAEFIFIYAPKIESIAKSRLNAFENFLIMDATNLWEVENKITQFSNCLSANLNRINLSRILEEEFRSKDIEKDIVDIINQSRQLTTELKTLSYQDPRVVKKYQNLQTATKEFERRVADFFAFCFSTRVYWIGGPDNPDGVILFRKGRETNGVIYDCKTTKKSTYRISVEDRNSMINYVKNTFLPHVKNYVNIDACMFIAPKFNLRNAINTRKKIKEEIGNIEVYFFPIDSLIKFGQSVVKNIHELSYKPEDKFEWYKKLFLESSLRKDECPTIIKSDLINEVVNKMLIQTSPLDVIFKKLKTQT